MLLCYFRRCLLPLLLLAATAAHAQLEPAAQYTKLTVAQLLAWTPTGPTALPANVSRVPLAPRQNSLAAQLNPTQSFSHKINYIPDGMTSWAGYLNEQNRFNLYNFTHWQYIDVLTWFDGPVALPTRPWVETAHRNGVKVIGSVFTSAADVTALVQRDAQGNFPAAQKLVDVAGYYGFDGWFFNEESRVPAATATELINMLKQLQALRPAGMEIHWYDAMVPSGGIAYQNALNVNNQTLLQDGTARVSDAMFTNYFWSGSNAINTSVTTATALNRSPFEVYMGADLWPARSNQSLFTQSAWIDNYFTAGSLAQPKLSMGLFAANLTYNGGFNAFNTNAADYANFYRTEVRMFAGNDLDVTTPDATGWKGFGHYVPVRSVINSLPFETNFCVGQGKVFANNGSQQARNWTDMSRQSLLPSWQWAKTGPAAVSVGFDFARAWYGGTSLRLAGSLNGNQATVKLYQTKLAVAGSTALSVTLKAGAVGPTASKLLLYFADNLAQPELLDLGSAPDTLWNTRNFPLAAYTGRELAIVGVQAIAAGVVPAYVLNLGNLRVYDSGTAAAAPVAAFTATPLVLTAGQSATFSNASTNASSYTWTFAGGSPASSTAVFPVVQYATPGTYAVKLVARSATGRDSLTRSGYISVGGGGASGGANTSLRLDGTTKYVDAGTVNLSGAALSLECWVKAASFKAAFPNISSLVGIEDPNNVALVRMGDAGLASNKLQFVLQVGTTARKLASPTALTANTWYHVAATFDGSTMKLYLNGVLDASLAASGSATASGIFTLGRNYDSARIIDGWLDEARAWTRALTPAEIAANACLVPGLTSGPVPGLAAYFRLNDGPGSIATDASGQGHTGTLANPAPADWSPDVPPQCAMLATAPTHAPAPALQLLPLENPVPGTTAELELRGATGAALLLQVFDMKGAVVLTQALQPAAGTTRVRVVLPATAGLYVVRIGLASAKLLRL